MNPVQVHELPGQLAGLLARGDVDYCIATDHFFGLAEGSIGDLQLASAQAHAKSVGAALESGGVLEDAALEALLDELAHGLQQSRGDRLAAVVFGMLDE